MKGRRFGKKVRKARQIYGKLRYCTSWEATVVKAFRDLYLYSKICAHGITFSI